MTQRTRRIWVVVFVVVVLLILLAVAGIGEGPNRPLEGQAGRATAPWLDVFAAITPLLAALLAISGVLATIYFTNLRESYRQDQERLLAEKRHEEERRLKEAELKAAQAARLRDERIAAYRKLLAATATASLSR
jgi:hypothetical protein